jgi:hypothetical protein
MQGEIPYFWGEICYAVRPKAANAGWWDHRLAVSTGWRRPLKRALEVLYLPK